MNTITEELRAELQKRIEYLPMLQDEHAKRETYSILNELLRAVQTLSKENQGLFDRIRLLSEKVINPVTNQVYGYDQTKKELASDVWLAQDKARRQADAIWNTQDRAAVNQHDRACVDNQQDLDSRRQADAAARAAQSQAAEVAK